MGSAHAASAPGMRQRGMGTLMATPGRASQAGSFLAIPAEKRVFPAPYSLLVPASHGGPIPAGLLGTANVPNVQGAGNDKNLLLLSCARWGHLELWAGAFLHDSPQGSSEPTSAERSPGKYLVPISEPRASFTAGAA